MKSQRGTIKKNQTIMPNKKRKFLEDQIKAVEENYQRKEIRNFCNDLKNIWSENYHSTLYIRNKEVHLQRMLYFEQILNERTGENQEEVQEKSCRNKAPTKVFIRVELPRNTLNTEDKR